MKTQTSLLALSLAILAVSPASAQDKPKLGEAAPVQNRARKIEDKEAREFVKTFKKQIKAGKRSMKGRIDACITLARVQNNLLVKPLLVVAQREKSKTVRQEAIKAISMQPLKRARPALLTLMKKFDIQDEPGTCAALVRAIGDNCYTKKDWRSFRKMFEKAITNDKAVGAQKAILQAIGKNKEVEALNFLLPHMDPPEPVNVDDASNPPASYWEARWKNWQKWKGDVLEAMYQITGQRFANSREARKWLQKNKARLIRESKRRNAKNTKKKKR